jgi:hypothetical protein
MIRVMTHYPSITAVIASDLDRRDLYRNQFFTAIDDVTGRGGIPSYV